MFGLYRMERQQQQEENESNGAASPGSPRLERGGGNGGGRHSRGAAKHRSGAPETKRLQRRDRELVALLGVCRYLTVRQLVELGLGAKTVKAAEYRLRSLAGEATQSKVRPFKPALTRALPFRAFDGKPFQLWALTPAGYAMAGAELGRLLRVPRVDVGAAFAEHSVFLTDLFVQLARPFVRIGVTTRELPFRWDVAEDVELPWREKSEGGGEKSRVIRPDAVLEVPTAKRRFFVECEMGTHTLTPLSPEKLQATVRKLERYDVCVSGYADFRARVSHYQRKYPDGWPCEVLFLVQRETRQLTTNDALAGARVSRGTRVLARAFTLQEAVGYCRRTFPGADEMPPMAAVEFVPRKEKGSRQFYGEDEHRTVNDFVLDMTAALSSANDALRRKGFAAVPVPASKAAMLDLFRRAQAEMHRQRSAEAPHV